MQYGRSVIYTDEKEITRENIMSVLQRAYSVHLKNAEDCKELIKLDKGEQKKCREKIYRKEVDNWVFDNICNEISTFKINYNWGNSLSFVQRGEKDTGNADEQNAIAIINEYYDSQNIKSKMQQLAYFVEVTGIGYTIVELNNEWEDGESPFTINVLDPQTTFVVRSSYYTDHRIILEVTYRKDSRGIKHFTCFTKNDRYEIERLSPMTSTLPQKDWGEIKDHLANQINRLPITEYIRDYDRMGCFERQIDEIKGISLLVSDFLNGVEQNINAIFWGNDIQFQEDENGNPIKPQNGEWLLTETTKDGRQPKIQPVTMDYNYSGLLEQISFRTSRVKEKCNTPLVTGAANNSTGIAVSDSSGWTNAEQEANRQDLIKYGCKNDELKVVLAVCKVTEIAEVPESVKMLNAKDAMATINRQKNYEMSVKTTALANMLSHGIYGLHALTAVNMFEDVNQVWNDSKELIEMYQKGLFQGSEEEQATTTDGGREAQIGNSPRIDGMSKETPEESS